MPQHVIQGARGGTSGTPIPQQAAMVQADRHERQPPRAAEVGIGILLETRRTVGHPRAMALTGALARAQEPRRAAVPG
jgi:hypothetical protein